LSPQQWPFSICHVAAPQQAGLAVETNPTKEDDGRIRSVGAP
jgi:hypothetical protein